MVALAHSPFPPGFPYDALVLGDPTVRLHIADKFRRGENWRTVAVVPRQVQNNSTDGRDWICGDLSPRTLSDWAPQSFAPV